MATVTYILHKGQKPTKEQLEELERASKMPIVYDEDSPEYTIEELKQFRRRNRRGDSK